LFGVKHLNFLDWMQAYELFVAKKHRSVEGFLLIRGIKQQMNDRRRAFT
jgi:hypothetical protein